MSRATVVAFAIFAAVLAATAPVAGQSSGLVVVSQHTTESDFESGSLSGVTVHDTGSSAFVAATSEQSHSESGTGVSPTSSQSITVGGDIDPRGPDGTGEPELTVTGSKKAHDTGVGDGGSYYFGSDPNEIVVSNIPDNEVTELSLNITDSMGSSEETFNVYIAPGDTQDGNLGDGALVGSCTTPYGSGGSSSEWCNMTASVDVSGYSQATLEFEGDTNELDRTYLLDAILDSSTPSGVSVSDGAGASATLGGFSNGETKTAAIDLSTSSSELDWSADDGDGELDWNLQMREYQYDGEGTYEGPEHDVSKAEEGFANLTLVNAAATVEWEYFDGSTWQVASSDTYSSSGNYTADVSGVDADRWRPSVSFSDESGDTTARLDDEGILFTPQDPSITSASPSPGAETSDPEIDLSADVEDPDFATAQGDSVTVEFLLDGSQVDEQTIASNQTVTTTVQPSLGGTHNWSVNVEGSYGQTDAIATREFSVPSTITIRDEQNPDNLINSTSVQVTAYYSGEIEKRTVNDGKLDLTGFPVDEPIIMRFNATNYTARTAVVESIYDQDSVFLLNDSTPQYIVRFQSQQLTGDFPEEDTVLFIERDITINGSTEWRTIAGDEFGVRGVPVHLQQDQRYRVRIKNLETTQTAVIGGYTAVQSETVDVSAGSAQIDIVETNTSYGWSVSENETGQYILAEYEDTANQTESIKLTVHERFNESNVLVDNVTYTNTNNLVQEIPLTSDQTNMTWTAELYVDRGNGYQHFRVPIGGGPTSLLPSELDETWVQAIGVFIMLITGMAFSTLNQGVGAISLSLVGGLLWYVGILGATTIGAAIVASLAISLVYHYRTGGGV